MFEACAASGDQRLKKFGILGNLLEETERCAANVLVWVLLCFPWTLVRIQRGTEKALTRSLRMALLKLRQDETWIGDGSPG